MPKKKMYSLVILAIAATIVASVCLNYFQHKRAEYYARRECFKHQESYTKLTGYTYTLPAGVDCAPYKQELDAAFPIQAL